MLARTTLNVTEVDAIVAFLSHPRKAAYTQPAQDHTTILAGGISMLPCL